MYRDAFGKFVPKFAHPFVTQDLDELWNALGMSVMAREAVAVSDARNAAIDGRLRAVRRRAKLSQADVARAVGVTEATVSRWEAGVRRPRREEALRLSALLEVLGRAD
jgi:DNA-binding transcriptional regulator YiaG